jgi:hypothetical protein
MSQTAKAKSSINISKLSTGELICTSVSAPASSVEANKSTQSAEQKKKLSQLKKQQRGLKNRRLGRIRILG